MKKGFTLAEVLITLSILGVVAALLIPSIHHRINKLIIKTQLRQAYSILEHIANSNGMPPSKLVKSAFEAESETKNVGSAFAEKYFEPNVKFIKSCKRIGSTCQIFPYDYIMFDKTTRLRDHADVQNAYHARYLLSNGMMFSFCGYLTNQIVIKIDVNGKKGPNLIGRDIFMFFLQDNNDIINFGYAGGTAKRSNYQTACGTANNSHSCAGAIMQNGWDFPDNYPFKDF